MTELQERSAFRPSLQRCAAKNPSTGRQCVKRTRHVWCRTHSVEVEAGRADAAMRTAVDALDNILVLPLPAKPLEGFSGAQALPCATDYLAADLIAEG